MCQSAWSHVSRRPSKRLQLIPKIGAMVLVFALFCLVPLCAQQTTTATTITRDAQAVTVLQSALAALGGATQPAPTSITASGTYTRFLANAPVSYPLRVEVLGFDKFNWQIDTPDLGTITTVVSGTSSWSQCSQWKEQIPVAEIPGTALENFPMLALSEWVSSSTIGLKMGGSETIAGRAVYHITITPTLVGNTDPRREKVYESTHNREIYIDQQTNLPVRVRYYRHPTDWRVGVAVDVDYSNFQSISGISFPMTTTTSQNGQQVSQVQFQSVNLNTSISASDFVEVSQ